MGLFSKWSANKGASDPLPELSDLTRDERSWIADHLTLAANLGFEVDDIESVRTMYERFASDWHATDKPERTDPNGVINMIGSAFGTHLERRTPLRWMVASDAHGNELVLHEPRTQMLIYPANLVAKRWVAASSGDFITAMSADVMRLFPSRRES